MPTIPANLRATSRRWQRRGTSVRRGGRSSGRRGAAAVELALCLPILLATALGMVEVCNVVFLMARLQSATFESARYAVRPATSTNVAATTAQVLSYCNTIISQFGVQGATVTFSPANLGSLAPQTLVTVTVSAPLNQNSATSFVLPTSMSLTCSATMVVE